MNYNHENTTELVFGMKGTGKSTQFLERLKRYPAKWKFVYDPNLEAARKLGWQAAQSVKGLCGLFDSRKPIVYYPGAMFPGEPEKGIAFFTQFVWNVCQGKQGVKLFACDEVQTCVGLHLKAIPPAFKMIMDQGRREEIDVLLAAQGINDIHSRIRKQATAVFVYKVPMTDNTAINALAEMGIAREEVLSLPHPKADKKVGWIYVDCLTGKKTRVIWPCA